jgi:hypothetical protein
VLGTGPWLNLLVALALLLPNLGVGVRRLHDTGKSGWLLLLALIPLAGVIILIVFFCQEGTRRREPVRPRSQGCRRLLARPAGGAARPAGCCAPRLSGGSIH